VLGAGAAYRLDNGVQRRWTSGAAAAVMAAASVPAALTPPTSIAAAVASLDADDNSDGAAELTPQAAGVRHPDEHVIGQECGCRGRRNLISKAVWLVNGAGRGMGSDIARLLWPLGMR
jgi:hypothetical protein